MATETNEKIILNDGTGFLNSHALQSRNNLFVYVDDGKSGIKDVFDALIDPEKTAHIVYDYYGTKLEFYGFTKMISVRDEGGGLITAVLEKVAGGE
jgi:hypothetical protein